MKGASTEVAFVLLTQQPWVRFLAKFSEEKLLRFLSLINGAG